MRTSNLPVTARAAFDGAASTYDSDFTQTPIARLMRQSVWSRLDAHFQTGMRVLELGCGTGEDAVRLARRGVHVTATDASGAMLAATRQKAERAGVAALVQTAPLDMNTLAAIQGGESEVQYDGVFSNFGPLNCIADFAPLVARLSAWTRHGARLVLVVMGPFCPWEIVWHLAHLQPHNAFRRWSRSGALAHVGGAQVRVWYPSPARLARTFAPAFRVLRVSGLGVLVPPPYVQKPQASLLTADRRRQTAVFDLLTSLNKLECRIAHHWPFNQCGDHYILELERR